MIVIAIPDQGKVSQIIPKGLLVIILYVYSHYRMLIGQYGTENRCRHPSEWIDKNENTAILTYIIVLFTNEPAKLSN